MYKDIVKNNISEIIKLHFSEKVPLAKISIKFLKKKERYHAISSYLKEIGYTPLSFSETHRRGKNNKSVNIDYFKEIDSHEKAYWLGFLYADGSVIYKGSKPVKIVLGLKERDPIEAFKRAIKSNNKVCEYDIFDKRTLKSYKRYCINICSMDFASHVINLGLKGKSKCADFPKIDERFFFDFLRGLFDGDGSVMDSRISFLGTNKIIEYIKNKLISDYSISETKTIVRYQFDDGQLCQFNIYKNKEKEKIYKLLYKDSTAETRLKRKYEKFNKILSDRLNSESGH